MTRVEANFTAGNSDPLPESVGWDVWFSKLESCRRLSDGWNGYTAPAPTASAVDHAYAFLQAMQQDHCDPTRLAPSAMGGVAITRKAHDRKVLVEFYNTGQVFALFSGPTTEMRVIPVAVDSLALQSFLAEMEAFLNG